MTIYHSPSVSDAEFVSFLEDAMEDLMVEKECIVMDDFNIDFVVDSFYERKLQDLMHTFGIQQYVKRLTRFLESNRSSIDMIFSNREIKINILHEIKVMDYAWLEVGLQSSSANDKFRKYMARDFSEFSMDRFVLASSS